MLFTEKSEKPDAIDFRTDQPFTLRSLQIFPARQPIQTNARLLVKENGGYRMLSEFKIDRFNANLNVGFDPYAPVVISVPETTASEFRLELANTASGTGLGEVEFLSLPAVERYPEKTLAKMFQTPLPYWHEYQWSVQPEVGVPLWLLIRGKYWIFQLSCKETALSGKLRRENGRSCVPVCSRRA